ncbi:MAG: hypothetical protein ACXAHE_09790 [Roseburia sp. 1XD42-69]
MTDVVNPKSASPDQLLPYHKKISAEGKALMKCFISYTYMVLKSGVPVLPYRDRETLRLRRIQFSFILSQCCVLVAGLAGFRAAYQGSFPQK